MLISSYIDIGNREINQDHLEFSTGTDISVAIVTDGCGSYTGSEHVAQEFAKQFVQACVDLEFQFELYPSDTMLNAILISSREVEKLVASFDLKDACSTAVMVVITKTQIITAHIGDSRAYIFKPDGSFWKSTDHSFVQELVDTGAIDEKEAENHKLSNIVTRVIDGVSVPEAEINIHQRDVGEGILLASDGFYLEIDNDWFNKLSCCREKSDIDKFLTQHGQYLKNEYQDADNQAAIVIF